MRTATVNQSRAVLKGKMAEQVAPLLPGFAYWPADARFLGDPVDYVIFDGYSACKDNHTDGGDIEVVILDIKRGTRRHLPASNAASPRLAEGGCVSRLCASSPMGRSMRRAGLWGASSVHEHLETDRGASI